MCSWIGSTRKDGALLIACAAMVVFGIGLRAYGLSFPAQITFDEHHFVENARNYLSGAADWNDHPPLGKLLVALGISIFGDNSFGWRVIPFALGVGSIAIAYGLGRSLFGDRRAGWLAAAFLALDGFFVAYSKTTLLDGMLAFFVLASALAIVRARTFWQVGLAGLLVGLACSIKFSGITMLPALVLATLVLGQAPRLSVLAAVFAPVVYVAQYMVGLSMSGKAYGLAAVFHDSWRLYQHHASLTHNVHPYISHWYAWLVPVKTITMRFTPTEDGLVRVMSMLGNPVLWWATSVTVIASGLFVAERMGRQLSPSVGATERVIGDGFFDLHQRAVSYLFLFWCLPMLPWVFSNRDPYVYHYLPAYGFGLVLVAGAVAFAYRRRKLLGLILVLLVAEVSVYYAPMWAQIPVTEEAYKQRMFLKGWR